MCKRSKESDYKYRKYAAVWDVHGTDQCYREFLLLYCVYTASDCPWACLREFGRDVCYGPVTPDEGSCHRHCRWRSLLLHILQAFEQLKTIILGIRGLATFFGHQLTQCISVANSSQQGSITIFSTYFSIWAAF